MEKPIIAVTIGKSHYPRMFSSESWKVLESFSEVIHHAGDEPAEKADLITLLKNADGCLTSWGVACLDRDVLAAAPKLKAMSHMGSSIKRFVSDALWERGIHVTSAGIALAKTVAETTLGLMLVGQKQIWPLGRHVREGGWRDSPVWDRWYSRELFRKEVGIIGASNVGRHLIKLLEPFETTILVYDPYLDENQASKLGVIKLELDDLVQRADIISLHTPATEETYQMLNARRLKMMKDDALLINTARGTLIEEKALIEELEKGRFFAFLDVTDPEPPSLDSPLRKLENVVVTPHIAGCIDNCNQMGELAVEELRRFFMGEPPVYQIKPELLKRIA